MCLVEDRPTGRRTGTGIRRRGLWYMDREGFGQMGSPCLGLLWKNESPWRYITVEWIMYPLIECKLFPDVMHGVDKTKLKHDACEFAKHTRMSYVSEGPRSIPFMLVHSDVWTSPVVSVSDAKHLLTATHMWHGSIWFVLMRHKDETFQCFKAFHAYVKNHFMFRNKW